MSINELLSEELWPNVKLILSKSINNLNIM